MEEAQILSACSEDSEGSHDLAVAVVLEEVESFLRHEEDQVEEETLLDQVVGGSGSLLKTLNKEMR